MALNPTDFKLILKDFLSQINGLIYVCRYFLPTNQKPLASQCIKKFLSVSCFKNYNFFRGTTTQIVEVN